MSYGYPNDILVPPQDVQALAWSEPMRDLVAKIELPDAGSKKLRISS